MSSYQPRFHVVVWVVGLLYLLCLRLGRVSISVLLVCFCSVGGCAVWVSGVLCPPSSQVMGPPPPLCALVPGLLVGWLLVFWLLGWLLGWLVGCWLIGSWAAEFGWLVGWLVGRCAAQAITPPMTRVCAVMQGNEEQHSFPRKLFPRRPTLRSRHAS